MGEHNIKSDTEAVVVSNVESLLVHPDYDRTTLNFDYAILTLETEIDLTLERNKHIQPVCLPLNPHVGGERVS